MEKNFFNFRHLTSDKIFTNEREIFFFKVKAFKNVTFLQFSTAEMKLNTKTFQWHAKMPKVFEEHDGIIKEKTAEYQKALKLRRERFVEELEGYNKQVCHNIQAK